MQQPLPGETKLSLKGDTFFKRLKEETLPMHQALEQLPLSSSIASPTVTLADYKNYLLKMLPVVQDLEENLYPLLEATVPDIGQRRKLQLLLQDLSQLEEVIPGMPVLPLTQTVQNVSIPFAMGILYVMEGSTLGGRFIGNNIQKNLGLTPENGATYFGGYGADTGLMWKHFLQNLDHFQSSHHAGEEIIQGANFAFTSIYNHFKD
jgi:heme oxygenase